MSRPLAIALLSGGLDSATAAALALKEGHRVIGLSLDYGQRHRRELEAAAAVADALG
ncbi:MAG: 7-cyano-7-deazaguanine synthase, partial [Cyanobium sp.]